MYYIKAEVWDFPVMIEQTRLKSYLSLAFSSWTQACDQLKQQLVLE